MPPQTLRAATRRSQRRCRRWSGGTARRRAVTTCPATARATAAGTVPSRSSIPRPGPPPGQSGSCPRRHGRGRGRQTSSSRRLTLWLSASSRRRSRPRKPHWRRTRISEAVHKAVRRIPLAAGAARPRLEVHASLDEVSEASLSKRYGA
eukprot:scaffold43380_cov66-Phaeocystis_antarctica.AAC.2